MPELHLFIDGFDLSKNTEIGNYTVSNVIGSEYSIIRYKKYGYNLKVEFTYHGSGDYINDFKNLNKYIRELMSKERIINSSHGTPYLCSLSEINHKSSQTKVTYNFTGFAHKA